MSAGGFLSLLVDFFSLASNEGNKKAVIGGVAVTAALLASTLVITFYDVVGERMPRAGEIALFALLTAVAYGGGQYIMLGFARRVNRDLGSRSAFFNLMYRVTVITQFVLMAILAAIVLQMIFFSHFSLFLVIAATAISAAPSGVLNAYMGYSILSWYRLDKRNVMLLLLGTAGIMAAIPSAGSIVVIQMQLVQAPAEIVAAGSNSSPPGMLGALFTMLVALPLFVSAIAEWGGIALMLRHFSRNIGRLKYWTLISLPLLMLLVGILPALAAASSSSRFSLYEGEFLAFRVLTVIGAVAFAVFVMGFAFQRMAKKVRQIHKGSIVEDYMVIASFGLVMLAIANLAPVQRITFPPFGASAHWFVALSTYLASIGIYSSAITVFDDAKLRQSIRKFAVKELTYLDSIGVAYMEQEIMNRAAKMAQQYSEASAGGRPQLPPTEDQLRQYLDEVLDELHKKKKD